MKKFQSIRTSLVFALALVLIISVFAGCGKKEETVKKVDTKVSKYAAEYPLDADGVTLTYWMPISANISGSVQNFGELPVAKELERLTGVKIEYVHSSEINTAEKFDLMIASGEITDMIRYNWNSYPGGAEAAIEKEIIVPLNKDGNSMIDAWAPDFKAAIESSDNALRCAKTDKGDIYSVGCISPEQELVSTEGPVIRKDWLDTLRLEMPVTLDDWYVTLKAFKKKKGAMMPLSMTSQGFFGGFVSGAYGQNLDFYHDDGIVKFGPAEKGWLETVSTLNKWYNEGLLDANFAVSDDAVIKAQLIEGQTGASWCSIEDIATLTNEIKEKDPEASFVGAPYPTLDGSKPQFGKTGAVFTPYAAITTQCKDPELAMKWLNFGYTEKGHMLFNFGIEGQSFEWVDKEYRRIEDNKYIRNEDGVFETETGKYPQYTKEITANEKGLSMLQALALYSDAGQGGNYRQDIRFFEQYLILPEQQSAFDAWYGSDAYKHYVPSSTIAQEEAKKYSQLYENICKVRDENWVKFITGERPLSEYEDFLKELEALGLKEMIAIRQAAYDAYLAR